VATFMSAARSCLATALSMNVRYVAVNFTMKEKPKCITTLTARRTENNARLRFLWT
jgi:hypothetical protein